MSTAADALHDGPTSPQDEISTSPIGLEFPIGLLLAGSKSKAWVRVHLASFFGPEVSLDPTHKIRVRWLGQGSEVAPCYVAPLYRSRVMPSHADGELQLDSPRQAGDYRLEIDVSDGRGERIGNHCLSRQVSVSAHTEARAALMTDVRPLSYAWGTDRGLPPHRHYMERFLEDCASDVHGRCLEFQNPAYARRLGGKRVSQLEILHIDDSNPLATIVADLTKPNDIPDDHFDCIICTHVLHMIYDLEPAVRDLHRILKPNGVLLVAVPHVSGYNSNIVEFWRFTVAGLGRLLTRCFSAGTVEVRGFGNSLVAAGDLRGMTAAEFTKTELEAHDPWCPAEICARAVKRGPA